MSLVIHPAHKGKEWVSCPPPIMGIWWCTGPPFSFSPLILCTMAWSSLSGVGPCGCASNRTAWKSFEGTPQPEAQIAYILLVDRLIPPSGHHQGEEESTPRSGSGGGGGGGGEVDLSLGMRVSTMGAIPFGDGRYVA